MIEQSYGWCCVHCGLLIKGKCNNVKGYVTHIDSCAMYDDETKLHIGGEE